MRLSAPAQTARLGSKQVQPAALVANIGGRRCAGPQPLALLSSVRPPAALPERTAAADVDAAVKQSAVRQDAAAVEVVQLLEGALPPAEEVRMLLQGLTQTRCTAKAAGGCMLPPPPCSAEHMCALRASALHGLWAPMTT